MATEVSRLDQARTWDFLRLPDLNAEPLPAPPPGGALPLRQGSGELGRRPHLGMRGWLLGMRGWLRGGRCG